MQADAGEPAFVADPCKRLAEWPAGSTAGSRSRPGAALWQSPGAALFFQGRIWNGFGLFAGPTEHVGARSRHAIRHGGREWPGRCRPGQLAD